MEEQVQQNSKTLGKHEREIEDAKEVSDAIIDRFGSMFKEVKDQFKHTGSQLEFLTDLVQKQQEKNKNSPEANTECIDQEDNREENKNLGNRDTPKKPRLGDSNATGTQSSR